MPSEFPSAVWDATLEADAAALVRLAAREDLADGVDWTTASTVDPDRRGEAAVVSRAAGVVAGLGIGPLVIAEFQADATWRPLVTDGEPIAPGQPVAVLQGRAGDLLTCERTVLNFLGRLCGVASLTRRFVDQVTGQAVGVYDTRKTTPGWRRLEKYAVRCGGGRNHRLGLSEAVLIKDNHLALSDEQGLTPAGAVRRARAHVQKHLPDRAAGMVIEVEVDTLDQLRDVLAAEPDIVLLDNMSNEELREAVAIRDAAPGKRAVLEASGGVNLDTIGTIATTGVDRISVGALTHSATALDLGLDWGGFAR